MFQSPSLRGSGRFGTTTRWRTRIGPLFQSPSLRGSGRFMRPPESGSGGRMSFQSPSLRGSGRFDYYIVGQAEECEFQSPSLRGSGRFTLPAEGGRGFGEKFQSPSLRGSGRFIVVQSRYPLRNVSFNPLHCGAVVASWGELRRAAEGRRVSIPFIAGQWSLPSSASATSFRRIRFQSPSLRGSGRFRARRDKKWRQFSRFNPLHCGAVVASGGPVASTVAAGRVSIPFIAGQWSLRTSC